MSSVIVAFMFAAGVAAWAYSKADRKTGNLTQTSITVAAVVFVLAFLIFWSILDLIAS
jgi:biotin transporter BioY